jgi:peptidoglycan hydrolase-like protein with peptidoglycan-binding domain
MTVFYVDISSFQSGINLSGWHAVAVKASQGTGYTDPGWGTFRTHAATVGAYFFGYHFLEQGNGSGQADHYFAVAGKTPCMIDFEPTTGSNPQLADAQAFCDRLRSRGGVCNLVYLPRWYWGNLGQPSLNGLSGRNLHLVASQYTGYSDSGPGWAPYGGMVPAVWQYTSTMRTGGFAQVDCNAFKGTFAQLQALVGGGSPQPAPAPAPAPAPPQPAPVPAGDVVVPFVTGKSAGGAHNALVAARLVPSAPAGQTPGQITLGITPKEGTDVKASSIITINAGTPPTVQLGDKSQWSWCVQYDLNRVNAHLSTDGSFGAATQAAVESFQSTHGLNQDGVVGPLTWAKLGGL